MHRNFVAALPALGIFASAAVIEREEKKQADADKDKPITRFGYTAYTRDGIKDLGRRPIMLAYNAGPGSRPSGFTWASSGRVAQW
jgi:hypothetical protein